MSFLFKPPPVPQMIMPDPKDVPSAEDKAREEEAEKRLKLANSKRKGARSTILTTPETEEEAVTLDKPTLLT
tara:strand:- start:39 stop:254 length:216 start_codon:yes stop_codon:yes gene_type:complete